MSDIQSDAAVEKKTCRPVVPHNDVECLHAVTCLCCGQHLSGGRPAAESATRGDV